MRDEARVCGAVPGYRGVALTLQGRASRSLLGAVVGTHVTELCRSTRAVVVPLARLSHCGWDCARLVPARGRGSQSVRLSGGWDVPSGRTFPHPAGDMQARPRARRKRPERLPPHLRGRPREPFGGPDAPGDLSRVLVPTNHRGAWHQGASPWSPAGGTLLPAPSPRTPESELRPAAKPIFQTRQHPRTHRNRFWGGRRAPKTTGIGTRCSCHNASGAEFARLSGS